MWPSYAINLAESIIRMGNRVRQLTTQYILYERIEAVHG